MRWFGYAWSVIANCIYLSVILYVFDKLDGRLEFILVSILGLIYVAVRTIGIGLVMMLYESDFVRQKEFAKIRTLLNDANVQSEFKEFDNIARDKSRRFVNMWIDIAFLALIGPLCLIELFSHL